MFIYSFCWEIYLDFFLVFNWSTTTVWKESKEIYLDFFSFLTGPQIQYENNHKFRLFHFLHRFTKSHKVCCWFQIQKLCHVKMKKRRLIIGFNRQWNHLDVAFCRSILLSNFLISYQVIIIPSVFCNCKFLSKRS